MSLKDYQESSFSDNSTEDTQFEETKNEVEYLDDEDEANPFANMSLGYLGPKLTDHECGRNKSNAYKLDLLRTRIQLLRHEHFRICEEKEKI